MLRVFLKLDADGAAGRTDKSRFLKVMYLGTSTLRFPTKIYF
jgi:hypothetical protein